MGATIVYVESSSIFLQNRVNEWRVIRPGLFIDRLKRARRYRPGAVVANLAVFFGDLVYR